MMLEPQASIIDSVTLGVTGCRDPRTFSGRNISFQRSPHRERSYSASHMYQSDIHISKLLISQNDIFSGWSVQSGFNTWLLSGGKLASLAMSILNIRTFWHGECIPWIGRPHLRWGDMLNWPSRARTTHSTAYSPGSVDARTYYSVGTQSDIKAASNLFSKIGPRQWSLCKRSRELWYPVVPFPIFRCPTTIRLVRNPRSPLLSMMPTQK